MTGSPIFSINLIIWKNPCNLNYHMSIKKSQAILKHFIDLKFIVSGLRCDQKTKPCFLFWGPFFSSTPGQDCRNTKWPAVYSARVLLAESLRTFLDNSDKGIEEKGKRKEEAEKSSKCPQGGVLPYKGLMGTCGQPGYVFRDFCLKQGIKFIIFCLNQGIDLSVFVLNRISFLGR